MTQHFALRSAALVAATLSLAGTAGAQTAALPVAQPVAAEVSLIEDVGGGARIDLSGKLRMLSQRVPAALCAVEAGIAPEAARSMLGAAVAEFDSILVALRDGDDARGIFGAEESRKTLHGILRVAEIWEPMRDDVDRAVAAGVAPADVATMQDRSHTLLERAKDLVVVISAQYSNPAELLQADALTIDIAGRQRMLAQRMSKDACMLSSGHGDVALAEDLGRTMDVYDASLEALVAGTRETGVIAPPSEEIAAGLDAIAARWEALSDHLAVLRDGGTVDAETRATLFDGLNRLTGEMNVLVGAYAEASKSGL